MILPGLPSARGPSAAEGGLDRVSHPHSPRSQPAIRPGHSDVGMGAVLSQVGPEEVVAYFSKTFNKAERRYCVTRRELLAIVRTISHFKYYIYSLPAFHGPN